MAAPQSTPLPEAPTRGEAEGQFVPKANAFVGALEPFRQQLQAQADFVNERSTETEENAALAQEASEMAMSSANFAGDWSGLSGAFDVPTSVLHDDTYWQLLEDVSNIQDDEPGVSAVWAPINVARSSVRSLSGIAELDSLDTSKLLDGQQFSVKDGSLVRKFFWDASAEEFDELFSLPSGPTVTNVMYYGAAGDGITDDTEAVEDAVEHAAANSRLLYFPSGRYLISRPVDLKGVSIRGDGMYQSAIVSDPNTPIANWIIGGRANDVATFYSRNHDHWFAADLEFDGSDTYTGGLVCAGGRGVHYYKLYAHNYANAPLQFYGRMEATDGPVLNSSMVGCVSERNRWNYVVDGACQNILISDNYSVDAVNRHISVHVDENQADFDGRGISVTNNMCVGRRSLPAAWESDPSRNRSDAAIRLRGGSQALFVHCADNHVRDWGETSSESVYVAGIQAFGNGAFNIIDNYLHDIGSPAGLPIYGVSLRGSVSNGTRVCGNTIFNLPSSGGDVRYAVFIENDSGRYMIRDNMGNGPGVTGGELVYTSAETVPATWFVSGNVAGSSEADDVVVIGG